MALCHKWDVKNDFAYVLQFFSLISDGLGSVNGLTVIHLKHFLWLNVMLRDQASRNGILLCGAVSSNEIFPALIPTEFSKPFLIPFQKVKKVKVL